MLIIHFLCWSTDGSRNPYGDKTVVCIWCCIVKPSFTVVVSCHYNLIRCLMKIVLHGRMSPYLYCLSDTKRLYNNNNKKTTTQQTNKQTNKKQQQKTTKNNNKKQRWTATKISPWVGRGSDYDGPDLKTIHLDALGRNFLCLFLGPPGIAVFAPVFQAVVWHLKCLNSWFLLSPYHCFIIVLSVIYLLPIMIHGWVRKRPRGPNNYTCLPIWKLKVWTGIP